MEVAFVNEWSNDHEIFCHLDGAADTFSLATGKRHALEGSFCVRVMDGRLPNIRRGHAPFRLSLVLD